LWRNEATDKSSGRCGYLCLKGRTVNYREYSQQPSPSAGVAKYDIDFGIESRGLNFCWDAMKYQDLLRGLIRLHILFHAVEGEVYGQWMIHELGRHGYSISPGTLYPMLSAMERNGYLKSKRHRAGRTFRRVYTATARGRSAYKVAKAQVRELSRELIEER
jgi:PadR family transcriptional regulator PadR